LNRSLICPSVVSLACSPAPEQAPGAAVNPSRSVGCAIEPKGRFVSVPGLPLVEGGLLFRLSQQWPAPEADGFETWKGLYRIDLEALGLLS